MKALVKSQNTGKPGLCLGSNCSLLKAMIFLRELCMRFLTSSIVEGTLNICCRYKQLMCNVVDQNWLDVFSVLSIAKET